MPDKLGSTLASATMGREGPLSAPPDPQEPLVGLLMHPLALPLAAATVLA